MQKRRDELTCSNVACHCKSPKSLDRKKYDSTPVTSVPTDAASQTVTESVTVKVEQTEWDESVERVSDADLEAMLDSDEEGDE